MLILKTCIKCQYECFTLSKHCPRCRIEKGIEHSLHYKGEENDE